MRVRGYILAGLLVGAALAAWWVRRPVPSAGAGPRPAGVRPDPRSLPPEVLERWQVLEATTRAADAGPWAAEREAERHEEVLVAIWDRIRSGDDPVGLLVPPDLESVAWAPGGPPDEPEPGFVRVASTGPGVVRPADAWREWLDRCRAAGWELDGMEWRLPGFVPAEPGAGASGRVTAEFHLLRPAAGERGILRASLDVRWHPASDPGTPPRIRRVDVVDWQWLTRAGRPWFETVAREEVVPEPGSIVIDPLLVRDLDGNGFPEVVLAGKNRVYVNHGGGNLEARRLAPRLDTVLIAALFVDLDGDGQVDLVGADGGGLVVVRGSGRVPMDAEPWHQPLPGLENPFSLAAGDVDGDGDVDLWLGQYKVPYRFGQMPVPYFDANDGFPSFLLVNDGRGTFRDVTVDAGLGGKRFRRTYGAGFVDVDGDGDLDLVNVSDFAGVDLYRNDGSGRFVDVTASAVSEPWVFGMGLVVADMDRDRWPDLMAIGMNSAVADRLDSLGLGLPGFEAHREHRARLAYGNRWWRNRGDGTFGMDPRARQLAATGWSWGAVVADLDNDGDDDFHVVNGHKSGASARDYETEFWTHDIHLATGPDLDPGLDLHFQSVASRRYGMGDSYGGHQRNPLRVRTRSGDFLEVGWLVGATLPDDCRNLVAADLDGDGRLDLVITVARFGTNPGQEIRVLRNSGPRGRWLDVEFPAGAPGGSAGRIDLETSEGIRSAWSVPGDGYRSQAPPVVHFGLAPDEAPRRVRVVLPGGRRWAAAVGPGAVRVARDAFAPEP